MWVHNTAASLAPIAHDHDGDAHTESSEATQVHRDTTYVAAGRARCDSVPRHMSPPKSPFACRATAAR
jgi:hypothetical protein